MPVPHKLVLKSEAGGTLPDSFCEDSVILIPQSENDLTRKEKLEIDKESWHEGDSLHSDGQLNRTKNTHLGHTTI